MVCRIDIISSYSNSKKTFKMFSKVVLFCAVFVAVNATGLFSGVAQHHYTVPVVRHVVPIHKTYVAPVAVAHSAPVVVAHAVPGGYSRSYDAKYFGASKYGYGAPLSYSTHSEVNHVHGAKFLSHVAPVSAYSTSTVVKHAAPVVAAHATPHVVGHLAYSNGLVGHGLLGHRLGGVVYNGHKSIHY